MELKSYQHKVIKDLETYLGYVQRYKKTDLAFNQYWQERIGPYNPLTNEGMQPYKNTIPHAAHVCIKVPTAGGKTFIACNALHSIFNAYSNEIPKAVIWLVPWSNLLDQTVSNLRNPDHPYRQKLDSLFNHRVEVYEKKDLLQGSNFNPTVVKEQLSIIVMGFASLRAKNKEDRKVYQENGQLASFASQYKNKLHILEDTDDTALINVIRSLHPVLVVDESHVTIPQVGGMFGGDKSRKQNLVEYGFRLPSEVGERGDGVEAPCLGRPCAIDAEALCFEDPADGLVPATAGRPESD